MVVVMMAVPVVMPVVVPVIMVMGVIMVMIMVMAMVMSVRGGGVIVRHGQVYSGNRGRCQPWGMRTGTSRALLRFRPFTGW